MPHSDSLILRVLRDPLGVAAALSLSEWDLCLQQCRSAGLLGRVACVLDEASEKPDLPERVLWHLGSARVIAAAQERELRWEVNRLARALAGIECQVILLKGAAYVMAALPPARGRLFADVDIMVPRARLAEVESALRKQGWEGMKLDEYDERYYRRWMHELPPIQHRDRKMAVDVHHNILPDTGRLHPNPELLLQGARALTGTRFSVLAPVDMVLHSAAHMFQDGQLAGSLRDLTDLDDLLRHFAASPNFWEELSRRAEQLELQRPLFYALRYTERLLDTPVPRGTGNAGAPNGLVLRLMDQLVERALVPAAYGRDSAATRAARWMLYVRSHWLRMPPHLLASHLTRKALRRRISG